MAVPLVLVGHEHHEPVFEALADRRLGLAGHAAFETFSVLTRLPLPHRRSPVDVGRVLSANFPESRFLSGEAAGLLLSTLAGDGIGGGSVYDAVVAAVAVEHHLSLLSRDRRAVEVYRRLGAEVEMLR